MRGLIQSNKVQSISVYYFKYFIVCTFSFCCMLPRLIFFSNDAIWTRFSVHCTFPLAYKEKSYQFCLDADGQQLEFLLFNSPRRLCFCGFLSDESLRFQFYSLWNSQQKLIYNGPPKTLSESAQSCNERSRGRKTWNACVCSFCG